MRRWLALILLASAAPAWAANSQGQSCKSADTAGRFASCTITGVTTGSTLAVAARSRTALATPPTYAGTTDGTHTYSTIESEGEGGVALSARLVLAYTASATSGDFTVQVEFGDSGVTQATQVVVSEIKGADTGAPLDKSDIASQLNPGTGTDAVATPAVTPATDGQYVLVALVHVDNTDLIAVGATPAFTALESTGGTAFLVQYYIQPTAASVTGVGTATVGTNFFKNGIATFKAASASGNAARMPLLGVGH